MKSSARILSNKEMDEKYQEHHKQGYEYPYSYKVSKNDQYLYFLGVHHTNDQNNPQFEKIRSVWKDFLRIANIKNSLVLVEGGNRSVEKDIKQAINKYGEAGFITYFAVEHGLPVYSPEPDDLFELKQLNKQFSKERIMYARFARTVAQWHRRLDKPDLKEYVEVFMKRDEKTTSWKDFDFSFDNFVQLHDEFHSHHFDPGNYNCFYRDSNPTVNEVSAASSFIRDKHILAEIKRFWREGKNLFIVYGSGHAIKLEPSLKALGLDYKKD